MSSSSRKPPPASSPWDDPLAKAPLAFVDLEMTGLDPARHRVIEVCIERVVGGEAVARMESYIRPEPLSAVVGNEHVHGIDRGCLETAPTFAEVLPQIETLLSGAVMVAHGARWDAAFLNAELGRLGRPQRPPHHLDTLALARRLMTADNYKLATLAAQLEIANNQAHRAGNDVRVTRGLFEHLLSQLSGEANLSPRVLWERGKGRMGLVPGILDAAEAAIEPAEPMTIRYRAARRGAKELIFVVTEVRRGLDPPVVLGYLHHTRGRRELRADRILSIEPLAS